MKSKICFIASIFMLVTSCKKDETTSNSMQTFSGMWSVDSVVTVSSENDPFFQIMVTIESPHFLDFNLSNQVIQKKIGSNDTAIFLHQQSQYALSDLDFNGLSDTTYVFFGAQGNSAKLEWTFSEDTIGIADNLRVRTMYLSK